MTPGRQAEPWADQAAAQREKAERALIELKASPDPIVAGYALWALELRGEDLARLRDLGV